MLICEKYIHFGKGFFLKFSRLLRLCRSGLGLSCGFFFRRCLRLFFKCRKLGARLGFFLGYFRLLLFFRGFGDRVRLSYLHFRGCFRFPMPCIENSFNFILIDVCKRCGFRHHHFLSTTPAPGQKYQYYDYQYNCHDCTGNHDHVVHDNLFYLGDDSGRGRGRC